MYSESEQIWQEIWLSIDLRRGSFGGRRVSAGMNAFHWLWVVSGAPSCQEWAVLLLFVEAVWGFSVCGITLNRFRNGSGTQIRRSEPQPPFQTVAGKVCLGTLSEIQSDDMCPRKTVAASRLEDVVLRQ